MTITDRLRAYANKRYLYNGEYSARKHCGFLAEEQSEILKSITIEQEIDGFFDTIIFAMNAIEDAGYNLDIVMDEGFKEIESRDGTIVNGKFEKFKDAESVSKWYKADYTKAKK